MQSTPKITIGIPTYKRNDHIYNALKSLSKQSYKNIKIIISNNSQDINDIDELKLIYHKFKHKFINIEFINQKKNIGAIKIIYFY